MFREHTWGGSGGLEARRSKQLSVMVYVSAGNPHPSVMYRSGGEQLLL